MFKKSAIDLNSAFYPSLHFTLSLQSAFYTQSAFYPWSAVCSLQSAVFVLQWPVSNLSVRETSVGQLLEADVQPNFVAQLRGHKNLKSLDSYHSASLKRQREMSAILNREPGTSAQSEENQVSTSTTTQQNVFTVQQIQPRTIFAGVHMGKFEGCTFNINVFCGDQSNIARLNENWSLSDRGTNRHYLHCSCTFGHFS